MSNDNDELDSDQGFWGQLDESPEPADWAGDELEVAYLRAMEALEASELQFPDPPAMASTDDPRVSDLTSEASTAHPVTGTSDALQAEVSAVVASTERIDEATLTGELKELSEKVSGEIPAAFRPAAAVTPRQILEALLFVGGEPLSARKLGNVLRGEFSTEYIESLLDDLNVQYSREGRPYEIRLGEGGYRIVLREDFERIRRKAYGLGPKEVKLSQEAIEVLAVIAYHQPLTGRAIEELGKQGAGGVIRQLIRRELVAVERTRGSKEVTYRTTPRFLSLFGLRNLNELPRLEQVGYK